MFCSAGHLVVCAKDISVPVRKVMANRNERQEANLKTVYKEQMYYPVNKIK